MRWLILLGLVLISLSGCSNAVNTSTRAGDAQLKERAKMAQDNLSLMRAAAIKYFAKNKSAPEMHDDLTGFGAGPADVKANEYYSEIGYTFFRLKFDENGQLIEGKFRATPMAEADALIVMLDAKTGDFEFSPKDPQEPASNGPAR